MTFSTYKDTPGRQAANILELDLDFCSLSYGVSPCVADLGLTNLLTRSDELTASGWVDENLTVTINQDTHPLTGATTVDELLETTANGFHRLYKIVGTPGVTKEWALAFIVSSIDRQFFELRIVNSTVPANFLYAVFDTTNGTVVLTGVGGDGEYARASMVKIAGTAYWRLSVAGIPDVNGSASDDLRLEFRLRDDNVDSQYVGDVTKGSLGCGAQLREGLYPGKYAPTTSASVDGGGTINDLCFNGFGNCQDTANFDNVPRTLRFIDTLERPYEFLNHYPSILSVKYAPTVLKPGGNLSIRGQVTVVLQDFATTDNEIDDYVRERSYNPEDQGTFFGKLKARHKFYIGRPMRVLEGYLDGQDITDFRTREYIIDDISGPTADGKVIVKGKDILSLAADVRAKCPTASTNTLRAAMDSSQTTLLPQTGEAAAMLAGDLHVRVNDEIIELVSESPTDTLNVVRGKGGTTGAAHAIDDAIQECKTYDDEPVIDVVQELLEDFANVPSSFIPYSDWEEEEAASLSGYDMTTIISEPTGVLSLLKEIAAITLLDIWYDDVAQEVKLKLQTPFTSVSETVNDVEDVLENTLKVKDLNAQRLTRVLIYYGMRNFARDLTETENFSFINFDIEADKEGVNKYNDERIKVIFSRWFDASNSQQVALTSSRLLDRFGITPKAVEFDLDAKDVERLTTGVVFDLNSRIEQDVDGSNATNRYQVTETKAIKPGSQYRYKCEAFFQDATPESLTISTDQTDYDIFVELGGPPGAVDVTLTINTLTLVKSSGSGPAITTTGMHPDSTLVIINNGEVHGGGGAGGAGGGCTINALYLPEPPPSCLYHGPRNNGSVGSPGGDALEITIAAVEIDNTNGELFGGAGGGGGGKAAFDSGAANSGGGGGGGLGESTAAGAAGGVSVEGVTSGSCPTTLNDGADGLDGTDVAEGTGGAGPGSGGDGGDGGDDWAVAGDAASVGASGGVGGYAVRLNGASIVWTGGNDPAQVKGTVG